MGCLFVCGDFVHIVPRSNVNQFKKIVGAKKKVLVQKNLLHSDAW